MPVVGLPQLVLLQNTPSAGLHCLQSSKIKQCSHLATVCMICWIYVYQHPNSGFVCILTSQILRQRSDAHPRNVKCYSLKVAFFFGSHLNLDQLCSYTRCQGILEMDIKGDFSSKFVYCFLLQIATDTLVHKSPCLLLQSDHVYHFVWCPIA